MSRFRYSFSKDTPAETAALRRQAEERLSKKQSKQRVGSGSQQFDADSKRAVHELQIHQIELEMQNEQLRKSREELESLLDKYRDLYDFAPVGYLTLAREGSIQEANLTAAKLLGLDRSDLIHQRFESRIPQGERPAFGAFLKKAFESQTKQICDIHFHREAKPPLTIRIEATSTGRECRAMMTDITERARAEEDRLILSKLESTGILAGGIAHDFNNLLTVILLNLELGQKLVPPGHELAHCLEGACKAVLASRHLTQQFITFAKGGTPIRKPTDLAVLIRESVRIALSGSQVQCEWSLPEDLWPIEVDAGQIAQVIRNLVQNAREAIKEGGTISVRAENAAWGSHDHPSLPIGDYVRVSIMDPGEGIAKEVLPNIFDPYFSTKQRGDKKGMGLGLTICHTVIQKHGGAIDAESEVGTGTTFHILLPAARHATGMTKPTVSQVPPRHGRILVMDDDEAIRHAIATALRLMGHQVELTEDGTAAVEVYVRARSQGRPFDVVFLDLTVRAGVGGQDAVRALLLKDPAVKAVVMSGYTNDPVVLDPKHYGFKAAISKPFNLDKLQELLTGILGQEEIGLFAAPSQEAAGE